MTTRGARLSAAWWGRDEWRAAADCILRARVRDGTAAVRLEDMLNTEIARTISVRALNAGRTALTIALQACARLRPDRKVVLVPAYVCPAVVDAVTSAGLRTDFVDVGDDLNLSVEFLSHRMNSGVLAAVAVHMYGLPAQIQELDPFCRANGVFLIDDAAHALGLDLGGRTLGSFGDAGVYSFAQGKVVSTGVRGSGGALLVNNPELANGIDAICRNLGPPNGRLDSFLHFALAYQLGRRSAMVDEQLEWLLEKWAPRLAARRVSVRYLPALISNLDARLALIQLERLTTVRAARQRLLDAYFEALAGHPRFELPQAARGRFLTRLICRLPCGSSAGQVRQRLLERNIETRLAYPVPSAPHPALLRTAATQARLIELPLSPDMTDSDTHWVFEQLDEVC